MFCFLSFLPDLVKCLERTLKLTAFCFLTPPDPTQLHPPKLPPQSVSMRHTSERGTQKALLAASTEFLHKPVGAAGARVTALPTALSGVPGSPARALAPSAWFLCPSLAHPPPGALRPHRSCHLPWAASLVSPHCESKRQTPSLPFPRRP